MKLKTFLLILNYFMTIHQWLAKQMIHNLNLMLILTKALIYIEYQDNK